MVEPEAGSRPGSSAGASSGPIPSRLELADSAGTQVTADTRRRGRAGAEIVLVVDGPVASTALRGDAVTRTASVAGVSSVLVAVVLLATSCGGGGGDGKSIVLYNGQHLGLTRAMVSAFESRPAPCPHPLERQRCPRRPDREEGSSSPADVYLTETRRSSCTSRSRAREAEPVGGEAGRPGTARRPASGPASLWVSSLVYNPSLLSRSKLLSRSSISPGPSGKEGRDLAVRLGLPAGRRRGIAHTARRPRRPGWG
jgi:hypothetical protein